MFYRYLSFCIFSTLLSSIPLVAGSYSGGTGNFSDPYQIANLDDWQELVSSPADWDNHFILTGDIDLSGITYTASPISPDMNNSETGFQGTEFTGSLDGQGYSIKNLNIDASEEDFVGLIGYVNGLNTNRGMIRNLNIDEAIIRGRDYTAAAVGYMYNWAARVENCSISGEIEGNESTGLVTGRSQAGTIEKCYLEGNVRGAMRVGGMAGQNGASITQCFCEVDVNSSGMFAGGVTGHNYFGSIENSYASGEVTGDEMVGGLVGGNQGTVTRCYAFGLVSGEYNIGGLIGSGLPSDVNESFWNTETTNQSSSQGGTPLTDTEMQNTQNFINAGWDYIEETVNGTEDIWRTSICTGYPTLSWLPVCNDKVSNPCLITPPATVAGSTLTATGSDITLLGYNDNTDVWYGFTCTETNKYTITIEPLDFDSTLAIFDEKLNEIVFNDDFFSGKSTVILKATAGKSYLIRISGYDGQTGDFTLTLEQDSVQAIQGDINYDGKVNLVDLAVFSENWLSGT